jgi:SAM-dependent methyltransferase
MPEEAPDPDTPPAAEFDAYAQNYAGGMDNPVKALLGESGDDFIAVKLRWLLHRFPDLRDRDNSFRVLDYGCGTAVLLRLMAEAGLRLDLAGCDISAAMLQETTRHWPAGIPGPTLYQQDGAHAPLPPESVDLIVISAVLHHVPPPDRPMVYAELHRLLRPGGRLVVFEHNPLNPVTRYVVAHTPIDQNAILLRAREVCSALSEIPFADLKTDYLMFLPPRLEAVVPLQRALGWLPLGAQYAVTARRTGSTRLATAPQA